MCNFEDNTIEKLHIAPYEYFFISEKEPGHEVTLFSYNWVVYAVAIFEATLVRLPLWMPSS